MVTSIRVILYNIADGLVIFKKLGNLNKVQMQTEVLDKEAETALLIQLKDGSEPAFEQLYAMYSLRIYRKLLKMVKIDVIADELTQDVFVKVWTKRDLIDVNQSFRSYLFSIAQHLMYDVYRKVSREDRLAAEIKALSTESYSNIDEIIHLKETEAMLHQAIAQLPPQQKLIFTACKLNGKTYEEIGAELGISVSTVNGHIVKATKSVKEYLLKTGAVSLFMLVTAALIEK